MKFFIDIKSKLRRSLPYFCLFSSSIFYMSVSFSSQLYLLCGPDEDGCSEDSYPYCACIPYNEEEANKPYCLDFDELTCKPLAKSPDCDPGLVYKNQASCLANIFQSVPVPPCIIKNRDFCIEKHAYICNEDGQPSSCRQS